MRVTRFVVVISVLGLLCVRSAMAAEGLTHREWTVDGVTREALVYSPAKSGGPAPLVFVFHGHGGTSASGSRAFHIETLWPEAIVVYPQGLNTPGQLSDPEGRKPGWQHLTGAQGDRDLKFFDAMLTSFVSEKRVDEKRVFVTGHSNGGAFTYLLWSQRGDRIAAVAPSGALNADALKGLKPKPVLHVAGKQDAIVKIEWQQKMIDAVIALNQCDAKGEVERGSITRYASKIGAPVLTYLYDGGHGFPREVPQLVVDFFKSMK